jgi:hypothetical protein
MKLHYYFLPLLAFSTAASAQPAKQDGETIVVTGSSLAKTERALKECLARGCPPEEDINATLAHAENLFVAGRYADARKIAKASIGRNGRHAKDHPVPVSDLYRANSRISAHLGEGGDFERSTWAIKRALKAGLPENDVRIVGADLEVAGMQASLGRIESARKTYQEVEEDARALGRGDIAAMARLRLAWLYQLDGETHTARQRLREIADDRTPEARIARLSALILLARFDREAGRTDTADALLAELKAANFRKPVLLFAPAVELPSREVGTSGSVTRLMATENFEKVWMDVGFWVTPEGRVADVEVLRNSGRLEWAAPLLKSIAGRIYSSAPEGSGEGSYRVERYSYTSLWGDRTGTRIRQRSADGRVEFLDLTAD